MPKTCTRCGAFNLSRNERCRVCGAVLTDGAPLKPLSTGAPARDAALGRLRVARLTLPFHEGGQFTVREKPVVVGRAEPAQKWRPDLDLADYGGADARFGVSRRHAHITFEDGVFVVADLGSLNGTFLNGWRVDAASLTLRRQDTRCLDPRDRSTQCGPPQPLDLGQLRGRSAPRSVTTTKRCMRPLLLHHCVEAYGAGTTVAVYMDRMVIAKCVEGRRHVPAPLYA